MQMNLTNCYRLLGVSSQANLEEIKASYRRLARQYHPDVNPDRAAQAQFIQVTEAYKSLLSALRRSQEKVPPAVQTSSSVQNKYEQQLKWKTYEHLQQLLREGRFTRAICLIEGLAQRCPQDTEVRQWRAITYQQQGRQLIQAGQTKKGRIYFKKALQLDPHNRSLWQEVQENLRNVT